MTPKLSYLGVGNLGAACLGPLAQDLSQATVKVFDLALMSTCGLSRGGSASNTHTGLSAGLGFSRALGPRASVPLNVGRSLLQFLAR